jgi:hypothetical protein
MRLAMNAPPLFARRFVADDGAATMYITWEAVSAGLAAFRKTTPICHVSESAKRAIKAASAPQLAGPALNRISPAGTSAPGGHLLSKLCDSQAGDIDQTVAGEHHLRSIESDTGADFASSWQPERRLGPSPKVG